MPGRVEEPQSSAEGKEAVVVTKPKQTLFSSPGVSLVRLDFRIS